MCELTDGIPLMEIIPNTQSQIPYSTKSHHI